MAQHYVSLKEVAARAGVSFQTASKVLNGGNVRVSAETEARIIAVAESLGYRPNTVARSLVQQTTATIGLVAVGRTAAEHLLSAIGGPPTFGSHIVPCRLVRRGSSGPSNGPVTGPPATPATSLPGAPAEAGPAVPYPSTERP